MLDIRDYYLGIIIPRVDYYQNNDRNRCVASISFDPFDNIPHSLALTMGEVTLLCKKGDKYYDEYYSMYKNELYYKMDEANKLGIMLVFVEPFQKYYTESPVFYDQEEMDKDYYKFFEVCGSRSYYIAHSKLYKEDAIVTLDDNPLVQFRKDYLESIYQRNGMSYQKKK